MSTLFKLTATAACIVTAGMASAQSDQGADSQGDKSPDQVKCHEIVTMDTAVVPGTLYYIAGYRHGSDKAGAMEGSTDASASDSGSTATDATGTDTTGDAMDSGDTAQSDMSASDTDSAASDDAAAGSDDMQPQIVRVSGFYEIPVEEVMTVCAETPDRNVSDVVDEKKRDSAAPDTQ